MQNKLKQFFLMVMVLIIPLTIFADTGIERKQGTHFTNKIRDYSEGEIQLIPEFSLTETIRNNIINHGTQFLVEFVFELPVLPPDAASLQSLAELLIDIGSLEGIKYWSGGRGRMYPYIKKSYRVEESGSRSSLPLPTITEDTNSVEFIQFQRDTSFGTNWYKVNLEIGSDAVLMNTLNLTELKAFTKKTSDAEGVLLQMAIIPYDDKTIMYCAVALREFPPIGWSQGGVAGSFNHRVSALEAWFADRVFN